MHARGGLQTEYMGKEWFENDSVSVAEGEKRGMGAWAYDENGWPSAFGNGLINGTGMEEGKVILLMQVHFSTKKICGVGMVKCVQITINTVLLKQV